MHPARKIEIEAAAARSLLNAIAETIADDDQAKMDAIEGETGLLEAIDAALDRIREMEAHRAAIKEMHRQVGDLILDERGLASRGLLVRHLVMPGGLEETRQILRFLACEVSAETFVNIMPQYRPAGLAARYPAIARPLRRAEFDKAIVIARQEGLRRLARD